MLETSESRTTSAYGGAFWVEADSLEVVRITIRLTDPPAASGIAASETSIDFERVNMGGTRSYPPARASLRVRAITGITALHEYSLSNCRAFQAQSTVSFGAPTAESAEALPDPRPSAVFPPGVNLNVEFTAEISSAESLAGDFIEGVLYRAAKRNGRVLAPQGALVRGRIRRLRRRTLPAVGSRLVLELTQIVVVGEPAPISATLSAVAHIRGMSRLLPRDYRPFASRLGQPARYFRRPASEPGQGALWIYGERFLIPPGMRTVWNTISPPSPPGAGN